MAHEKAPDFYIVGAVSFISVPNVKVPTLPEQPIFSRRHANRCVCQCNVGKVIPSFNERASRRAAPTYGLQCRVAWRWRRRITSTNARKERVKGFLLRSGNGSGTAGAGVVGQVSPQPAVAPKRNSDRVEATVSKRAIREIRCEVVSRNLGEDITLGGPIRKR